VTGSGNKILVISGFAVILLASLLLGYFATSPAATLAAVQRDGADLTRLMRFMAGLKAMLAIGATAGVVWRLAAPVSLPWFAAYAVAGAAMAAGPGVIWGMAHVGAGALLLHGGLFATVLLLWRDPAVGSSLAAMVERRRAA
jgi:hypothetical protein